MKLKQAIGVSILGLFVSATVSAEESRERRTEVVVEVEEENEWIDWDDTRVVASIRGGLDYAKPAGKTTEVALEADYPAPNQYIPTEKWHTAGLWGALIGVEIPVFEPGNRWQTGVSYYGTSDFHLQGDVYEYSTPLLDNLQYTYKVRNTRILWENRWLTAMNRWFDLYFLAGIGWSQNKATDYRETNKTDPLAQPNRAFKDKTVSSFTYSFGFGMEAALTDHLRAGIGYQYSDLGKVELGEIAGQGTSDKISVSNTPAHELVGSLTYIF